MQLLTDDSVGFKELSSEIAYFPSISTRLLFLANSTWAAPVVPITSVDLACSKLGLSVIRSISLALSIASPFNPMKCVGFDNQKFWMSSLMVAESAKILALNSHKVSADHYAAIHTAGIIHNIGMLWLADRYPKATSSALIQHKNNPELSVAEGLATFCQVSYTDIGGKLASAWELPPILLCALKEHNNIDYCGPYTEVSHTIGLATELMRSVFSSQEATDFSDLRIEKLLLERDAIESIHVQMHAKQDEMSKLVSAYLSAN
jgi:HD-like signal output (HDOD) protein